MKIAYLILAHRYPNQLIRLIKSLNTEDTHFFIHLDKKMDEQMVKNLHTDLAFNNVFFVKRFTCHWAGFGIMQATFQGFKEIMESGNSYDYISLLSGQDYPIKSNEYIQAFFASHNGTSFIEHIPFPKPDWIRQNGGWDRIKYWHFRGKNYYFVFPYHKRFKQTKLLKKLMRFSFWLDIRRNFPKDLHPYGGAQFWCLHKTHADKVYEFLQQNKSYFNYFKYVFVSDEILFQTIIGNLKDKSKVHNDTLHFLEWRRKGAILYTSDFGNIEKTHYLFARKFDTTVDKDILDLIDKNILQKTIPEKIFL
jgi:hypothetical protein